MRIQLLLILGVCGVCSLQGCNNAKSPEAVASDVAVAEQKAEAKVSETRQDALQEADKAAEKANDKLTALNNTQATGDYQIMIAKADGDHQVSIEKCNVLQGAEQKSCKDRADADYDAAKKTAKAVELAQKQ